MATQEITIRKATVEDMPAVHGLVVELAIYEKEEHMVSTTPEIYKKDFEEGRFQCIVAEHQEKVVGMVLFFPTYSTWRGKMMYLDDFVVTESYRRKGVGQLLYDALMEESKNQGAILTKWQVLDWNEPAINFYKKNNATIETEWLNAKVYHKKFD